MKFTEAEEQLKFAEDFLERVGNSESHQEFKKWWQAFRNCLATACYSIRNQLKNADYQKNHRIYQAINKAEDQLELQYIIQARHSSFHRIDPVSEVSPGSISYYAPEPPTVEVQEDGSIVAPAHNLLNIKIVRPRIKLIPVSNRGMVYSVPEYESVSGVATEHDPITLGTVAISQIRKAVEEIEKK
ncbi:hypothetical protein DN062_17835 [Nitrincola tibetensis]|uniref:Uncharacterized protein n=1 Tax=Nitrincola tibetensis TaxID=2219697 RepID=A0A364NHD7_9GAMM|nr:hypothetical protein [Nitrincola tibetensis]RAU16538.1 hypothetical protein DN062_17835 [Nitrincola tibetensis]